MQRSAGGHSFRVSIESPKYKTSRESLEEACSVKALRSAISARLPHYASVRGCFNWLCASCSELEMPTSLQRRAAYVTALAQHFLLRVATRSHSSFPFHARVSLCSAHCLNNREAIRQDSYWLILEFCNATNSSLTRGHSPPTRIDSMTLRWIFKSSMHLALFLYAGLWNSDKQRQKTLPDFGNRLNSISHWKIQIFMNES